MVGIVALYSNGAVGYGLFISVRGLLEAWGLGSERADWLANLAAKEIHVPDLGVTTVGDVAKAQLRQNYLWRATYILAAAERLRDAKDVAHAETVEQGYFMRHLAAEERRLRAATLVDIAATLLNDRKEEQPHPDVNLLSWRAVIDDKTTPECRWCNGRNFRADSIPMYGVPGSVHPRCRCTVGPPIPGAPLIPSA